MAKRPRLRLGLRDTTWRQQTAGLVLVCGNGGGGNGGALSLGPVIGMRMLAASSRDARKLIDLAVGGTHFRPLTPLVRPSCTKSTVGGLFAGLTVDSR